MWRRWRKKGGPSKFKSLIKVPLSECEICGAFCKASLSHSVVKSCLFLKIEMHNLISEYTWDSPIAIQSYQQQTCPTLKTSVRIVQSAKTAAGWNAPNVGNRVKKTQHSWHRSIDRKHIFCYVKFEGGLFIVLTRKALDQQKETPFRVWRWWSPDQGS